MADIVTKIITGSGIRQGTAISQVMVNGNTFVNVSRAQIDKVNITALDNKYTNRWDNYGSCYNTSG